MGLVLMKLTVRKKYGFTSLIYKRKPQNRIGSVIKSLKKYGFDPFLNSTPTKNRINRKNRMGATQVENRKTAKPEGQDWVSKEVSNDRI